MTTRAVGIIPARYHSSRLPGKPLEKIGEMPMIQHVYQQAAKAKSLSEVIVATDHPKIEAAVKSFGGNVVMTADTHENGTSRCFEVFSQLSQNFDVLVNIQGDEPFLEPQLIDQLVEVFKKEEVEIATPIHPLEDYKDLMNPSKVKVCISESGRALYFSRNAIPYVREEKNPKQWPSKFPYFKHIGIYAFSGKIIPQIEKLPASPLEEAEKLEQLRWLANDLYIQTVLTTEQGFAVDTFDDLYRAKRLWTEMNS